MDPQNSVNQRFKRRIALSTLIYVSSLFAALYLIKFREVSGAAAWALALLPALGAIGMFYAVGKLIQEHQDEFLRMLLVRQNLIATGFALALTIVWAFLELFGLVGHVAPFYVLVLWAVGSLVGGVSNRITHGSWGNCR